jgi:hypothetical protein
VAPVTKILIVPDLSGTTDRSRPERIAMARTILEEIKATRPTASRHAPSARYAIEVAAADSFGGEVIWRGSEFELDELTTDWWTRMQASRKSYGRCTRLSTLWQTVADFFGPAMTDCTAPRELILLSDLIEEPATASGKCRAASYGPSPNVPWDVLQTADTYAYFVPDQVKSAWEPVLTAHGLSDRVHLFADGGPLGKVPLVPTPPVCGASPETHAKAVHAVKVGVVGIGSAMLAALVLPFLLAGRRG